MIIDGKELWLHREFVCIGTPCTIHNPSAHPMLGWPKNLRMDLAACPLIERMCAHDRPHPDPDSVDFLNRTDDRHEDWGEHDCDGCCARGQKEATN
jgi:hypothetical protein